MIIRVANPIYDSVFKYLMEDERIARTVLSIFAQERGGGGTNTPQRVRQ